MQENQDNETLDETMTVGSESQEPPKLSPSTDDMQTNKILAIVGHLGPLTAIGYIAAPLIIWLLYKEKNNSFVTEHAKQAMIYQGVVGIVGSCLGMFSFVASVLTGGLAVFLLLPAGLLFGLIIMIPSLIAAYKALNGEEYTYPVSGALSKKF